MGQTLDSVEGFGQNDQIFAIFIFVSVLTHISHSSFLQYIICGDKLTNIVNYEGPYRGKGVPETVKGGPM